jgi:hypothetical protein
MYYKLLRYYQANPRVQVEDHITNSCNAIKEFLFNKELPTSITREHHIYETRYCLGCGRTTLYIPEDFRIDRLHVFTCAHCNHELTERIFSGEYNPIAVLSHELSIPFQQELDKVVRQLHTNPNSLGSIKNSLNI